jgi:hypothetical protein
MEFVEVPYEVLYGDFERVGGEYGSGVCVCVLCCGLLGERGDAPLGKGVMLL